MDVTGGLNGKGDISGWEYWETIDCRRLDSGELQVEWC